MKCLNKAIAYILCLALIMNISTVAYGTELINKSENIHSFTVKVRSDEYSASSVIFYEFEGKYYLSLDDIKDFTRCTLTEDTDTITLTHGLREIVINKSTGQMIDSGMVNQGNILLLNYNGMYLCEGIPMLRYLGATCSIRDEMIEILMPSFTIWESIMPDYLDYYFNINELYGGEDNVKISLICDIIADVLDGVSGHGLLANADMHLEDALYEILNVDLMKYGKAKDSATTLIQKINKFLASSVFDMVLDTSDNTYDTVHEALDYYVKFYVSGKNDILLDMMTQTNDLEYASDLASQIQAQVYSQSAAKANLKSAKTAQSFMDIGMLAFDIAITSNSLMQFDDDTRNLFTRTINQEIFEYADYYDISWNNVSDEISNTLKNTQSIVSDVAIEKVSEFALKKITEEGAKSALAMFTSNANIYAAAAQIGFFVASLINYESSQAYSADMNAIWLSAVQYDVAMLASSLLVKERDEFHFSSIDSLEKVKDMFTLYYRTTIAFAENIALSIEEFGSKKDKKWVEWFSSTTEESVANYAAEYLYRITNCTLVPIVDFSEIHDNIINDEWILNASAGDVPVRTTSGERDIVLVLDVSGSMSGMPMAETKKASVNFIDTILDEDASIGIVTYDNSASMLSDFSVDETALTTAVSSIYDGGGTNIESGLAQARSMLNTSNAKKKIIVLMSDGEPNDGKEGDDLIAYADDIKDDGIIIYTLGFFESLGSYKSSAQILMEGIASDGCHYEVASADNLVFFFKDVADQINGQKYIYIRIACPVDVSVSYQGETLDSSRDALSQRTEFGTLTYEENENASANTDDRIKILRLKEGVDYDVQIIGTGRGLMDYTIGFMDEDGEYSDLREFEDIKITKTTVIDTVAKVSDETVLNIDEDGDGKYDIRYRAEENGYGEEINSYLDIFVLIGISSAAIMLVISLLLKLIRRKHR